MEENQICFQKCPRCSEFGLERLRTHSHCVQCNYSEDGSIGTFDGFNFTRPKQNEKAQREGLESQDLDLGEGLVA